MAASFRATDECRLECPIWASVSNVLDMSGGQCPLFRSLPDAVRSISLLDTMCETRKRVPVTDGGLPHIESETVQHAADDDPDMVRLAGHSRPRLRPTIRAARGGVAPPTRQSAATRERGAK